MNMKNTFIGSLILFFVGSSAMAIEESNIEKFNWNGIEVVYLKDDRFPTYNVSVYFADGAIRDLDTGVKGETSAAFSLMNMGTRRYNQKDISDNLEFYGASYGATVFHEQVVYSISGLVKDVSPTVKKICHLFQDATFPLNELKKEKGRKISGLENMVNNAPAIAHRAFREITLSDTPFAFPTDGKLKDIKKINPKGLKSTLDYFNKKVKKRIYLSGPKEVLALKNVFLNDCRWNVEGEQFERKVSYEPKKFNGPNIHLVTVPKANQARVIIGRFINQDESTQPALDLVANDYLGGGFTSRLNEEIRVNRNLTYSIYSVISMQKYYGRSMIASFTKNETIREIIESIRIVIEGVVAGKSSQQAFVRTQSSLSGSHPFKFESTGRFLGELIQQDHLDRPYSEIYEFQNKVRSYKYQDAVNLIGKMFNWNEMTILVLGDKSLLKSLKTLGPVKVHDYKEFL